MIRTTNANIFVFLALEILFNLLDSIAALNLLESFPFRVGVTFKVVAIVFLILRKLAFSIFVAKFHFIFFRLYTIYVLRLIYNFGIQFQNCK